MNTKYMTPPLFSTVVSLEITRTRHTHTHRHPEELRGIHGFVQLVSDLFVCVRELLNGPVHRRKCLHGLVECQRYTPHGIVGEWRFLQKSER